jgi:trans-2,3-dihydro-3-hydroxyanthranilate isomerase
VAVSVLDLEFRHVDVFSTEPFQGNGLVVVLDADGLSQELMQTVTREMRQFETVFVSEVDLGARSATLRIFTEDEELAFAGHPVLGAGAVLHSLVPLEPEAASAHERWTLAVGRRPIVVRTRSGEDWVDTEMDQGVPVFGPPVRGDLAAALADALGLSSAQVHPTLAMQVVSTGLDYLIVPVVGDGLRAARIGRRDFGALLAEVEATFVYVLDPERPEGRTWDNAGRVEDVATGSAAGPAAAYLMQYHAHPPGEPLVLHQGRYVGRPSTIAIRPEPGGRLWVGGPVARVATGRFQVAVG